MEKRSTADDGRKYSKCETVVSSEIRRDIWPCMECTLAGHAWNALWRATLIKYNVSLSVSQDSAEVRVESTDPTVNELNWTPRAECDL